MSTNENTPISGQFWDWMQSYWHHNREFPPAHPDWRKKADLVDGKVPAGQLPSYVDDVLEFDSYESLPQPGEKGKIYITTKDNKQFRWGGSAYIEINSDENVMTLNTEQSVGGRKYFVTSNGSDILNQKLWLRSFDGSNPAAVYYKDGYGSGTLSFDGDQFHLTNAGVSSNAYLNVKGIKKDNSSDNYLLTGGGGHEEKSKFIFGSNYKGTTEGYSPDLGLSNNSFSPKKSGFYRPNGENGYGSLLMWVNHPQVGNGEYGAGLAFDYGGGEAYLTGIDSSGNKAPNKKLWHSGNFSNSDIQNWKNLSNNVFITNDQDPTNLYIKENKFGWLNGAVTGAGHVKSWTGNYIAISGVPGVGHTSQLLISKNQLLFRCNYGNEDTAFNEVFHTGNFNQADYVKLNSIQTIDAHKTFNAGLKSSQYEWSGSTTTPAGKVTKESAFFNLGSDYGYGISTNIIGGLDIMANQSGQPIRFWAGNGNDNPFNVVNFYKDIARYYTSISINEGKEIRLKGPDDISHYVKHFSDDTDGFGVSTGFAVKPYNNSDVNWLLVNSSGAYINGNRIWHSGNFNPDSKANVSELGNYISKSVVYEEDFDSISGYGASGIYRANNDKGGVKSLYSPMLHMAGQDTMSQMQIQYGNDPNVSGTLYYRGGINNSWGPWRTAWDNVNFDPSKKVSASNSQYALDWNGSQTSLMRNNVLEGSLYHSGNLDITDYYKINNGGISNQSQLVSNGLQFISVGNSGNNFDGDLANKTLEGTFANFSGANKNSKELGFSLFAPTSINQGIYYKNYYHSGQETLWKKLIDSTEIRNYATNSFVDSTYVKKWENADAIGFSSGQSGEAPYIYHHTDGYVFLATQNWAVERKEKAVAIGFSSGISTGAPYIIHQNDGFVFLATKNWSINSFIPKTHPVAAINQSQINGWNNSISQSSASEEVILEDDTLKIQPDEFSLEGSGSYDIGSRKKLVHVLFREGKELNIREMIRRQTIVVFNFSKNEINLNIEGLKPYPLPPGMQVTLYISDEWEILVYNETGFKKMQ